MANEKKVGITFFTHIERNNVSGIQILLNQDSITPIMA